MHHQYKACIWQAKYERGGLSSKLPFEFQWSRCEIRNQHIRILITHQEWKTINREKDWCSNIPGYKCKPLRMRNCQVRKRNHYVRSLTSFSKPHGRQLNPSLSLNHNASSTSTLHFSWMTNIRQISTSNMTNRSRSQGKENTPFFCDLISVASPTVNVVPRQGKEGGTEWAYWVHT